MQRWYGRGRPRLVFFRARAARGCLTCPISAETELACVLALGESSLHRWRRWRQDQILEGSVSSALLSSRLPSKHFLTLFKIAESVERVRKQLRAVVHRSFCSAKTNFAIWTRKKRLGTTMNLNLGHHRVYVTMGQPHRPEYRLLRRSCWCCKFAGSACHD